MRARHGELALTWVFIGLFTGCDAFAPAHDDEFQGGNFGPSNPPAGFFGPTGAGRAGDVDDRAGAPLNNGGSGGSSSGGGGGSLAGAGAGGAGGFDTSDAAAPDEQLALDAGRDAAALRDAASDAALE